MDYKIVKKTNPLGTKTYVVLVKKRTFLFIPIWHSVGYTKYTNTIDTQWWKLYSYKYESLQLAEEALQKYIEWKDGNHSIELVRDL